MIIYDSLFLAVAKNSEMVVITADNRLPRALESAAQARLVHPVADVNSLVLDGR